MDGELEGWLYAVDRDRSEEMHPSTMLEILYAEQNTRFDMHDGISKTKRSLAHYAQVHVDSMELTLTRSRGLSLLALC